MQRATGARALAGACARNPVALAVPCHRVTGRNGKLTGFRWGLSRKAAILYHEASLTGEGLGFARCFCKLGLLKFGYAYSS